MSAFTGVSSTFVVPRSRIAIGDVDADRVDVDARVVELDNVGVDLDDRGR